MTKPVFSLSEYLKSYILALCFLLFSLGIQRTAYAAPALDINALAQDYAHVQAAPEILSAQRNSVMVFVSFSMPKPALKEWLNQANKIGAPVLLRGFENNSFQQTAKDYQALMGTQHQGIQIDPPSFERYHIRQVPAVVMTSTSGEYDVVYGNASLMDILDIFEREGSNKEIQTNAGQLKDVLEGNSQ